MLTMTGISDIDVACAEVIVPRAIGVGQPRGGRHHGRQAAAAAK